MHLGVAQMHDYELSQYHEYMRRSWYAIEEAQVAQDRGDMSTHHTLIARSYEYAERARTLLRKRLIESAPFPRV